MNAPLSPERLAEIRAGRTEYRSTAQLDAAVDDLLLEVGRLRAERDRYRSAWKSARERAGIDGREAAYWMTLARRQEAEAARLRATIDRVRALADFYEGACQIASTFAASLRESLDGEDEIR